MSREEPSSRAGGNQAGQDADGLTLDELCDRAGVSIRTVRYYIGEGLLPPPHGHGAAARYTDEHLDRLTAIGKMKERFLPLKEIRRVLDRMGKDDIRDAAATARRSVGRMDDEANRPRFSAAITTRPERDRNRGRAMFLTPPPTEIREESSAADYIAEVLDHRDGETHPAPGGRPRRGFRSPEATSWRRVAISDEAELLIEEGAYRRRQEQIESLVAWAQRVLKGS